VIVAKILWRLPTTPQPLLQSTSKYCLPRVVVGARGRRSPTDAVELMSGGKPYLLAQIANNMGAETIVAYAPSTKFYVEDRLAGRPWITRLPFPVDVIERVESRDLVSNTTLVSTYRYRHRHWHHAAHSGEGDERSRRWDLLTERLHVRS
jgi:hypothetical protein